MVTLLSLMSVVGLNVFSCTGTFSRSSSVSQPSITLGGGGGGGAKDKITDNN